MLSQQLNLGPNIFFPATFVMASLYSAINQLEVHPKFIEFVNNFDATTLESDEHMTSHTATVPPDTFYWIPSAKWFSIEAEISHIMVLHSDPKRKKQCSI